MVKGIIVIMRIFNSNLITVLAIFITLLCSPVVFSDDGVETEAKNRILGASLLLDNLGMEALTDEMIEQQMDLQVQADPSMKPFKHILIEFMQKYMSYKVLRPKFIEMYASTFTASELRNLNEFYATPTGKKAISTIPELMAKGSQLGLRQLLNNMAELEQMIMDEIAKNPELNY